MRKLLVALMMVAFAATAFAADVTFSGSYEFDGKYQKNYGLHPTTDADNAVNQYYEHDFDLWMNVQTDKDTFFKTKLELLDDTVGHNYGSGAVNGSGSDDAYGENTQFSVQRAWMGHNFGAVTVEAGLMNSGTWGYAFADDAEGSYRVKATFNNVAGGKLSVLTQKKAENGDDEVKDAEKDDSDKYSVGYKGTFGGIMVAPKIDYDINSNVINQDYKGADNSTIDFDLAVGGKFGALNVETEFKYTTLSYDSEDASHKDYDLYGIYVNLGYNMGAATVGFLTAYGSTDKDMQKGFDFKDDFDSTFILGDDMGVGYKGLDADGNPVVTGNGDLTGFWANAIYATYDVNDKLNLMAKFAYAMSNWDDNVLEDATAYEFDAALNYAITKELTYYVNAGYAQIDLDGIEDPDAIYLVKHGLVISF